MKKMLKLIPWAIGLLTSETQGIYEKNAGQNEWYIENIGELNDLKFVQDSDQVYTVSTDGVLSLFATEKQTFDWKRQLFTDAPEEADEKFMLSYLSRNLLAFSQKRALLLNSAGHVNLKVDFGTIFGQSFSLDKNSGQTVAVNMFDHVGQVFICFAHGSKLVVYQDGRYNTELAIGSGDIKIVEMVHDPIKAILTVVAIKDKNTLLSFAVDLTSMTVTKSSVSEEMPQPVVSAAKSLNYVMIETAKEFKFVDPVTLKDVKSFAKTAGEVEFSVNDDVVLVKKAGLAKKTTLFNLESGKSKDVDLSSFSDNGCAVQRHLQTENVMLRSASSLEDIKLALSCQASFQLISPDGSIVFETKTLNFLNNGGVKKLFKSSGEPGNFMVQFEDMSLHFISQDPANEHRIQWTREEGLSDIKQLEILSQDAQVGHALDYVKHWEQDISFDKVPQRIIQRYVENFSMMLQMVFSVKDLIDIESIKSIDEQALDVYGTRKTLVALSNCGKIFGFSSYDGSLLWTSTYFGADAPRKIIIRQNYQRADEVMESQIVAVFSDSMKFMSASTGQILYSQALKRPADQFVLINLKNSQSQYILAINQDDLDVAGSQMYAYPQEDLPSEINFSEENIFFTRIDYTKGVLKGYQIGANWVPTKVWQANLAQVPGEQILQVRSQHQTASEIEPMHYLPTTQLNENIIYKYLDSNLFSVVTLCPETNILSVYIINGVSGKIVYKFKETGVAATESIDMFLSENYFLLAFKRASKTSGGLPIQELSVTEFYQAHQDDDTVKLLKDLYVNKADRLLQTEFSSFDMETPVVIQESYLLTMDVKKIALTQSLSHVTSKMAVMITSNDQVYTIENMIFTARRQHKQEQEEAKIRAAEVGLPPSMKTLNDTDVFEVKSPLLPLYDGVIPQKNTRFVSYDLQLLNLKKLYTFPTRLESTSQVIALGHDIFFARITPESNFDRLHENFKGILLIGVIAGLAIALAAAITYQSSKDLKEKFLMK